MKPQSRYWNPEWRQRYALAALIFVHVLWVFIGRHAFTIWRGTATFFSSPMLMVAEKIEQWSYERAKKIHALDKAQEELDALRAEIAELTLEKQKDGAKLIEADQAIDLLGLKKILPLEVRAARVIANNRNAPYGGIIIDLGEDGDLEMDQGIISAEGVVGRIWSVGSSQSIVLPLDAYNASTSVMLAKSRATGVLQGSKAPGVSTIRYISNQEAIQVGEPVYTSGLDRVFPPGMLIGYVSEISAGANEMNIAVTLAAPLDKLGILFVLPVTPKLEFETKLEMPQSVSRRGRN
ncbi:MAG: rod shape-determining protein MreC [Holophagales bacterium]|jgi:rod shape-determining protein MreC|nr:rod shape-determining protein MreC [Holophagales bacterium]